MGANSGSSARDKQKMLRGQRDKALVPHGHTTRFLYLMLKQIDTKQIDWQKVADGTGIATAASARNRYSRFRKQVDSQIDGDAIQAKQEQREEDEISDSFSFNSRPTTPIRAEGTNVGRRIKTEPGTASITDQDTGQAPPQDFVNGAEANDLVGFPSFCAPPHTPNIKCEQGLYDDFGDRLIKREKSVDEDTDSASFSALSSHYYGSPHVSPHGHSPFFAQQPFNLSPSPLFSAHRPSIEPPTHRSITSSSSLPSLPTPFSPHRPSIPSPLAQYRTGNHQNTLGTSRVLPAAAYGRSPFLSPQENRAQKPKSSLSNSNSGKAGKGSAGEPVDIDD